MTELKPEPVMIPKWRCPECGSIHTTEEGCIEHIAAQHAPPYPEAQALMGKFVAYDTVSSHNILRVSRASRFHVEGRGVSISTDLGVGCDGREWLDISRKEHTVIQTEAEARELWERWCDEFADEVRRTSVENFDYILKEARP